MPDTAGVGTSTIQKNINLQVSVSNLAGETVTRDGLQSVGNGKVSDGDNAFSFGTGTARVTLDERQILQASSYTASASGAYGTGGAVVTGTPTFDRPASVTVDERFGITANATSFDYATGNFTSYNVVLDGSGSAGTAAAVVSASGSNVAAFAATGMAAGSSVSITFNYNELKYLTTAAAAVPPKSTAVSHSKAAPRVSSRRLRSTTSAPRPGSPRTR